MPKNERMLTGVLSSEGLGLGRKDEETVPGFLLRVHNAAGASKLYGSAGHHELT